MHSAQREKKRHMVFRLSPQWKGERKSLQAALREAVLSFIGEFGLAKSGFRLLHLEPDGKMGVATCSRESLADVLAALALANAVGGEKGRIIVESVSGTLSTLREKYPFIPKSRNQPE
jgi:RNase P/RNase MRP subunit POP5